MNGSSLGDANSTVHANTVFTTILEINIFEY